MTDWVTLGVRTSHRALIRLGSLIFFSLGHRLADKIFEAPAKKTVYGGFRGLTGSVIWRAARLPVTSLILRVTSTSCVLE